ncbi:hypothetical protein ACFTY8_18900 [Streptomyces mirabilis]|uniref:hypothetical protein n=1 Tax=Streptomyces mirabilis TaxID=68239 RepID=UPI0036319D9E
MFNEFELYKISTLLRKYSLTCMKDQGYTSINFPTPSSPGVTKHNERRYGITDGLLASRLGYRIPSIKKGSTSSTNTTTLSADEEFTLTGGSTKPGELGKGGRNKFNKKVPAGGCSGVALKKIGYFPGDTPGNPTKVQALDKESFAGSLKSDRVKRSLEKWSLCMRDNGYTYAPEPFSASNDHRFATRWVTKLEKDVATADTRCKQSSHLLTIWSAEETKIQRSLITEHQKELYGIQKQRDTTLSIIERRSESSS